METKPAYLSKTLWSNALLAVVALAYPPASEWFVAHPDVLVGVFTVLNVLLRFATKDKLVLY